MQASVWKVKFNWIKPDGSFHVAAEMHITCPTAADALVIFNHSAPEKGEGWAHKITALEWLRFVSDN